jgi:tetratricopeptide (TPR) repeat protein
MLAYSQGDNERGIPFARHAVDLARQTGDRRLLAYALGFLGSSTVFLGRYAEAESYLREAAEAATQAGAGPLAGMPLAMLGQVITMRDPDSALGRQYISEGAARMHEAGDRWMANMAQMGMAFAAQRRGDLKDARARFAALIPLFQELGDRHRVNMVKSEIAHIDRHEGKFDAAEAAYRETILAWKRLGHRAAIAHQLESFAFLAQHRKDGVRAAHLYGAAEALREAIGIHMTPFEKEEYDGEVARLRAGMDEKEFGAALAEGRRFTMEQAVTFALSNTPASSGQGARPPSP